MIQPMDSSTALHHHLIHANFLLDKVVYYSDWDEISLFLVDILDRPYRSTGTLRCCWTRHRRRDERIRTRSWHVQMDLGGETCLDR